MNLDKVAFTAGFNSVEKYAVASGPQAPLAQQLAGFAASPLSWGAAKLYQHAAPVRNWTNREVVAPVKNWAGEQLRQGGKEAVNEKINHYTGAIGNFLKNPLTLAAGGIGGGLLLAGLLNRNDNTPGQPTAAVPQQIEQQQQSKRFAFNKPPITG